MKELKLALSKCRKSAPGPDGIMIPMIKKNLPPLITLFLISGYSQNLSLYTNQTNEVH